MHEAIIQCWNESQKSYVEIADELHISKGIVAGVIHRAKEKGLITRFEKNGRKKSVVQPLVTPTGMPHQDGKPVSIRHHQDWMCPMIISNVDSPVLYCGKAKVKRYCAEHTKIIYQPFVPPRRK